MLRNNRTMTDVLWVVRAGRKAAYLPEFVEGNFIAVDFDDVYADDLSRIDEPTLKAKITTASLRNQITQLNSFAYKMDIGDLVIVPHLTTHHREYIIARIAGPYRYDPKKSEAGCHRRDVQWLGVIARETLSKGATNTLGSVLTVFRPTAVEPEIRAHLTALTPLTRPEPSPETILEPLPRVESVLSKPAPTLPAAPGAAEPDTRVVAMNARRSFTPAQLEIDLDVDGRAQIMCSHPALVMEQTPRHTQPSSDWAGVPGIYILTGTMLQHSSQRTGVERTLTTTLIVRPWAYVGLSEDFLGRLASHRQAKPEWRRALLVRSGAAPFSSDDIKYLERRIHAGLVDTEEVMLDQVTPRGNLSAQPRNTTQLDACADTVIAVLRLTGTLI